MQTRSGKVYANASSSAYSLKEKRPSVVEIKVEKRPSSQRITARTERVTAALKPTPVDKPTFNGRPITITSSRIDNSSRNRIPCGFIKPTLISDQLAEFLGKPAGTKFARTEVSRLINKYIQVNSLQDPQNMRIINVDSKLRSLLNVGKNDEVTYFNLQKYMKPHFYRE
jgi:chromatin remodeling complex protein RSC6